ncbi:hypothetical protein ECC02_007299 [Trypanosoma cruzi]|uniref:Uncharacterized protein n=1 Tax=Trypanosoma cruzi TaxID=5693 RepID=A0A7J6XYR0_TRYCR|nr:hypothetical protein ECC02_011800 [Trypanosoma cruzi]KAF5219661.1 hypothetical protein ECC02_007299 [Trypanosoma cruzi]
MRETKAGAFLTVTPAFCDTSSLICDKLISSATLGWLRTSPNRIPVELQERWCTPNSLEVVFVSLSRTTLSTKTPVFCSSKPNNLTGEKHSGLLRDLVLRGVTSPHFRRMGDDDAVTALFVVMVVVVVSTMTGPVGSTRVGCNCCSRCWPSTRVIAKTGERRTHVGNGISSITERRGHPPFFSQIVYIICVIYIYIYIYIYI